MNNCEQIYECTVLCYKFNNGLQQWGLFGQNTRCFWLVWPSHCLKGSSHKPVFSLVETSYAVREGDQFKVEIKKAGTAASPVNVVVQILSSTDHGGQDFIGTSQPYVFPAGTEVMIETVTFSVRDDDIPEEDEAFPIQLLVTNGHGVVGIPDMATVIIVANDDAFGIFGFSTVCA
ncbi:hypothetical protein NP493_692g00001 [Ridgeia piscesae]|uniref:Calx-beta domain-containing protein n=1 Tax=Ridgeia piscesae TaxID=27915 RepID=A0AAD9KSK1_RIDPI|nr:hypothetical protein NP493_692g00001 [Ridgeia piscesae]